jgi:hypothetical protein
MAANQPDRPSRSSDGSRSSAFWAVVGLAAFLIVAAIGTLISSLSQAVIGIGLFLLGGVVGGVSGAVVALLADKELIEELVPRSSFNESRRTSLEELYASKAVNPEGLRKIEGSATVCDVWVVTRQPEVEFDPNSENYFRPVVVKNTKRGVMYHYVIRSSDAQRSVVEQLRKGLPDDKVEVNVLRDNLWNLLPFVDGAIVIHRHARDSSLHAYFEYPDESPRLWIGLSTAKSARWMLEIEKLLKSQEV